MIKRSSRIALFLAAFLFFVAVEAGVPAGEAVAGKRDIAKTTLPNGMTVILERDTSAPVVAFQMWVRAGSADESPGDAGVAHVFEHMLFKGTKKRGVGRIAKEVEAAGGYINAYTSFDTTVYHLAVASRFFSTGLDIISDSVQNSSFDPSELKKELEVVMEELRKDEDEPDRKLHQQTLRAAYTVHPYGRPVIGYEKTVKAITRDSILGFFKKWYIPNNMTLVVVGDFDKDTALSEIKKSFKDFKKRPDPHRPRSVEPLQKDLRTVVSSQSVNQTRIAMAFHIPGLKHNDVYAIDVTADILSNGVTSRLYKRLKTDAELVYTISAYAMTPKEPGVFLVFATLNADNVDRAVKEIISEVERLGYEGPLQAELDRAKLSLESGFVYDRETMQGKADQLGYYETASGDISFEEKYLDGIRGVTPEDVRLVIRKYLNPRTSTVSVLLSDGEKSAIGDNTLASMVTKATESAEAAFSKIIEARDVTVVKLENGMTLIVKEDHSNETVAMYATFSGGLRAEVPATNGVGNFTAGMLDRGTATRSREALAREVEDMAGSVGGFSGWNSTGVSAKFLSKFFDRGIAVFADVVENPSFPEDEMEKLRKDVLAAIKREEDYLPGYTFKLLYRGLYKRHPYGMPAHGTKESVEGLKKEDLRAFYDRVFVPPNMVLSVVGDVKSGYVIEKVKEAFKEFKRAGGPPPLPAPAPDMPSQGIISTGETKQKEQTNIGMGFLGPRITDEDVYPMAVLSEVLSAQGGRLFIELREKQSLAYAVTAFTRPGVDPGLFAVYIGSAPDKKDKAIEGIIKELEKVTTEKITGEELQRAKGALIGGYEMGLQDVGSQASDMATNELLGLGYDHYKKYADRLNQVTAKDVLNAAKKYITLDRYVISVVGPDKGQADR
ncbi:MAG: insulinase family protein [Deltaproteobacteria bacterium]|nr:insulinase family protein [Deltaproteobacteria bacterium]